MMAKKSFKSKNPFEKRQEEAARTRERYPDRVPVIVEKAAKSDVPDIERNKYLVPAEISVGAFVFVIRRKMKIDPDKAIFIFVNDILPPTAALLSAIYEENKDEDGFLYDIQWREHVWDILKYPEWLNRKFSKSCNYLQSFSFTH